MKLIVVLDNIRSAYNVGSVFRTCDGAGDCEIYVCGISPTPEHPKVEKTSLGSTSSVPWRYFKTTKDALESLEKNNIPTFAIELTDKSKTYSDIKYPETLAVILGHETEGVDRHILEKVANHISVPMRGKKESLNVATVAGIVIYEIVKQLTNHGKN